jgi:hypothetical protein
MNSYNNAHQLFHGEHSAMAVQTAQESGITSACHIRGGIAA